MKGLLFAALFILHVLDLLFDQCELLGKKPNGISLAARDGAERQADDEQEAEPNHEHEVREHLEAEHIGDVAHLLAEEANQDHGDGKPQPQQRVLEVEPALRHQIEHVQHEDHAERGEYD